MPEANTQNMSTFNFGQAVFIMFAPPPYISKPSTGACLQYSAVFEGRDFRAAINHLWVVVEQRTMMNARLIADLDKTKGVTNSDCLSDLCQ